MVDEVAPTDAPSADESAVEPPRSVGEPPRRTGWATALRAIRTLLGAVTLVLGVLWLLLTSTQGSTRGTDITVGVVLTAGSLVLLMPHRVHLPRRLTAISTTALAVIGTAAGLLVQSAVACCRFAYFIDRGWPYHWLQRAAVADDAATAYRLAQSASWRPDIVTLAVDLLLWAYAGMLLVVILQLFGLVRADATDARAQAEAQEQQA